MLTLTWTVTLSATEPEPNMATIKSDLAKVGADVSPDAQYTVKHIDHSQEKHSIVVLDRVIQGHVTEYCIHGYTICVMCQHPVYCGSESIKVLRDTNTLPVCVQCAKEKLNVDGRQPDGHVNDHRRADGPHED